jgi:hypothetical protein
MTFEQAFCSSPWLHLRITNTGDYEYCRWANKTLAESSINIGTVGPQQYFQQYLAPVRKMLLEGNQPAGCHECRTMERHHKVSGRQRQLLKVGVTTENFTRTMLSSNWLEEFKKSQADGNTDLMPQDWQIDLGNYCNSACVFCFPRFSSRLAQDWKRLGFIDELPPNSWCNDPAKLQVFLDAIDASPKITYLHFIGGETLITPAFEVILDALLARGLEKQVTLGFTTNLTTWDQQVIDKLCQFQIHLGLSIESFDTINDYVRWPSKIESVTNMISKWQKLAQSQGWLVQLRTTPTVLTVGHLLTVYEYAQANGLTVESCNFLEDPAMMQPSVLPLPLRQLIIDRMKSWVGNKIVGTNTVINTRNPETIETHNMQDLNSYIDYLTYQPDNSHRLPELTTYLMALESLRKNSIVDYLPEYEELFRTAGYQTPH